MRHRLTTRDRHTATLARMDRRAMEQPTIERPATEYTLPPSRDPNPALITYANRSIVRLVHPMTGGELWRVNGTCYATLDLARAAVDATREEKAS